MRKSFSMVLALAVSMGMSAVCPAALAATETAPADVYNEVYSCDFESAQTLAVKSNVKYENSIKTNAYSGENYYSVKKIGQDVAPVAAEVVLDTPIESGSGKCVISFDINLPGLTESDHLIALRAFSTVPGASDIPDSTGATLNVIKAKDDPMLCSYSTAVTGEGWWSTYCAIGAEGGAATANALYGTWFTVKAVIDTTEGVADYYFGDTWVGSARNNELKKGIAAFQIQSWQGWNGFGEMLIDNISVMSESAFASGFNGVDTVSISSDSTAITFKGDVMDLVTDITLFDEMTGETISPILGYDSGEIVAELQTKPAAEHIYTVTLTGDTDDIVGYVSFKTGEVEAELTSMLSYDFEDGQLPAAFGTGDIISVNKDIDDQSNTVLELCADAPVGDNSIFGAELALGDKAIEPASGKYVISYDIKYFMDGVSKYPMFYLAGVTPSGTQLAMNAIREWPGMDSRLGYSTNYNWWDTASTKLSPKDAEWMNIRIEIDTDNNRTDFYFDNNYAGSQDGITASNGDSYLSGLSGLVFYIGLSDSNYADVYIDNLNISKVTKGVFAAMDTRMVDAKGNEIKTLSGVKAGDTITVSRGIVNTTDNAGNADILVAVYNNGVLSDVKVRTAAADDFFVKENIPVTIKSADGLSIKCFAWDSADTMTPISKY